MSLLRKIEKSLDQRLRALFGGSGEQPGGREAIELYRDALDQIAQRATVGKRGDRVFPFDLISVELLAQSAERQAVLEAIFDPSQMADDIRATLTEERTSAPANLRAEVHYMEMAPLELRVICGKSAPDQVPGAEQGTRVPLAPMRLRTVVGISSAEEFRVEQSRVNLGREHEVVDSLGRAIRRNDLYFEEAAHEANASVSRSHAHLGYDETSGEWRIYDDGSSLGTSIFRDGHRIGVPPHSSRGVLLRAGDEIYLGQVRLKFVN